MKKFLRNLALVCATLFAYQTANSQTVAVTADLKTMFGGAAATKTQVCLSLVDGNGNQLSNPRTSGGVIVPTATQCVVPDGSGHVATTAIANDQITPSGSVYSVTYLYNGRSVHGDIYQFLLADVTENLNTKLGLSVIPVIPAPTGDTTYARLDGNNQPFTATITAPALVVSSGTLQLPFGLVGSPSLMFAGDSTSGLYHIGTSRLGITLGGSNAVDFQTTVAKFNNGSVATNAFTNLASTAGLSFSGAQTALIGNGTNGDANGSLLVSGNSQSSPIISARSNTFRTTGNSLEFGHANSAGYGSNLGWETTSGQPNICFMCENGTNANSYRTRGNTASIIRATTGGVLQFGSVASSNADNQAFANNLQITMTTGAVVGNSTFSGTNFTGTTASGAGLSALSGASGSNAQITIGRTATEGEIAVPSANGQFFTNSDLAAGDITIRNDSSSRKVYIGAGATIAPIAATSAGLNFYGATSGSTAVQATATASGTLTLPAVTDTLAGIAATQTLTNKRVTPRTTALASSTTFTSNSDTDDITTMNMTGVAGTLTIGAPTGTPTDGQKLVFRIKTTNAQTYSFNATFAFSTTVTAPTTTAAGKTDYIGLMWNATNTKWDVVAVDQGH